METRRDPNKAAVDHPGDAAGDETQRLGLADLAEAAGVSVRTVRYYIAEGLLPPPHGAGPRSAYGSGHLDRLRLIGRLKDAYLPLREIRRRLDSLDDPAVRALLDHLGPPAAAAADRAPPPPDDAAGYLARVMGRRRPSPSPTSSSRAAPRSVELRSPPPEQVDAGGAPGAAAVAADALPAAAFALDPALAVVPLGPEPIADGEAWRRIRLGPDAELLIRDAAYRRRPDRIEWLIRWARKVFES